ncbi:MAG: hypothetical protein HON77_19030 [Gammaproteobacteria bacterium]|jgi:hypothetical protein|nr:hypothetical protein [Gammaproteobacteria bacterium]
MMKNIVFIAVLMMSLPSWAALNWHTGTVTRTVIEENKYGQCMVVITPNVNLSAPACSSSWVSFSCTGDFNSSKVGYQKMEAALLALVTGKRVSVLVNDAKKHNGYCFVERIDNLSY